MSTVEDAGFGEQIGIGLGKQIEMRERYPAVQTISSQTRGAVLIEERTCTALLSELNLLQDPNTRPTVDRNDERMLHPLAGAYGIWQADFGYLVSLGREVAEVFTDWTKKAFGAPDQITSINCAALGIGVVFRAFRLQCEWPFMESLANLHSRQVYSILLEDGLNIRERQTLMVRALHHTEVPRDQAHLRYALDRLAGVCEDSFSLADGAGGAYRVINRFWLDLVPRI